MNRLILLGGLPEKSRVAELMSREFEAHDIAERLNLHISRVWARIADIRRDLGVPAHD